MNHEIEDKKELKEELGKKIKSIREAMGISQRELARRIDLPNSNLKYIEDGINAPSFEIYKKIIIELNPNSKNRGRMDYLYSGIRGTPPPDICEFIMDNTELYEAIRGNSSKLGNEQIEKISLIINGKMW